MYRLWLTRDNVAYVSMYLLLGCSTKKCKVIGLSLKHRETDLADGKFNQILFIFLLKLFRIRCQIYRKRISYVLYQFSLLQYFETKWQELSLLQYFQTNWQGLSLQQRQSNWYCLLIPLYRIELLLLLIQQQQYYKN